MGAAKRGQGWSLLALAVLSLVWGYTWVLAKQGLAYAPPFAFAGQVAEGGPDAPCCNEGRGGAQTCGRDCADAAPGISPTGTEACNSP